MKKYGGYLIGVLCVCLFAAAVPATADTPDITGQWYGTWDITDPIQLNSNFSVYFWDGPYGLLAVMYVPELGLFNDYLPLAVEASPDGYVVTIGVPGVVEITGLLDGNSVAGSFNWVIAPNPPLVYSGSWQIEKYTGEELVPGEAPGPACENVPPLYCMGDAAYCSELVPFDPQSGPGYFDQTDENQTYSYLRRDLMVLVKYAAAKAACKTAEWDYGNLAPLGLGDMSEADGSTPGTSTGYLRHPPGTHVNGNDIDIAYFQLYAADNRLRPVGVHYDGYDEAYHLVETPYALDAWRTALFIAYIAEHPRLRVIGVDGQIGPILDDTFDTLVELGWIDAELRASIPLAYETEDTGRGWFLFHHHHMHVSMNPIYDVVSSAEIQPDTLNKSSMGAFVTAHIEFDPRLDASEIDTNGVALLLDGCTALYADPEQVTISDYNENGIPDVTVKFDRQEVVASIENGDVEISIIGAIDGMYFQESDTIRVMGVPPMGAGQGTQQQSRSHGPMVRLGNRRM